VSQDAIRRAVRERRLPSWKKGGEYYLEPKSLDAIDLGRRGTTPKDATGAVKPLEFHIGHDSASHSSAELWTDWDGHIAQADGKTHRRWRRAVLKTAGAGGKLRVFELTPATEENELTFGGFWVRGHFEVVLKHNAPKAAREAWEALPT
jgi:hypothetical protein